MRTFPDLHTYLAKTGTSAYRLAADLGISRGYMSRLLAGIQQPSLTLAVRIHDHCRVPLRSLLKRNEADARRTA